MVRFRTRDGVFVVPAEQVLEVRSAAEVKPLPGHREDVAGLIQREGGALTVLSTWGTDGDHILVLQTRGGAFGVLVEQVLGVASIAESDIASSPPGQARPLVGGVVKVPTGFELLISADELWRQLSDGAGSTPPAGRLADELPLRVLLVEDSVVVQVLAKRLLGKLGYSIDVAANGKEAIDAMDRGAYDIVFMDVQMPGMDGLAAMKEIALRWPSDHPSIIAMSASDAASDRQACLDAGMDDYLSKPVREADLRAMLRKWGSGRVRVDGAVGMTAQ